MRRAAFAQLALLLAASRSGLLSLAEPNTFVAGPRFVEVIEHSVTLELGVSADGYLWSYLTSPDVVLTVAEIKAGVAKLATSPPECAKFAMTIAAELFTYSLADCHMSRGSAFALHIYIESADGGTMYREVFQVYSDPVPVPNGPFCFDIDAEYIGATVNQTVASVVDAEECQRLCVASAACIHFQYVNAPGRTDSGQCSLLATDPPTGVSTVAEGITSGPKSCDSRSVNTLRPHPSLVGSVPNPPLRSVAFTLVVDGVNFDEDHDRVYMAPIDVNCSNVTAASGVRVRGASPSTFEGWAGLPCNMSNYVAGVARLACGAPPDSILFRELGEVKVCLCDAGRTPYGCTKPEYFTFSTLASSLQVIGPYEDQVRYCPTQSPCTISGIEGYMLRPGDKMMIRESCGSTGRPLVAAYTNGSRSFTAAGVYIFDQPNLATCPPGHISGPCVVARMCYCPASAYLDYPCLEDGEYIIDVGTLYYLGVPTAPGRPAILQEDFESFAIRWGYPSFDGGADVLNYTLYFRTCPDNGPSAIGESTEITLPAEPAGDGPALNGTYQFRSVPYGVDYIYFVDIRPATRYCVSVSAWNTAGQGRRSAELAWLTDVRPPHIANYEALSPLPLALEHGVPMAPLLPTVLTDDCSALPSVINGQIRAKDCDVQIFEVCPALPRGLTLDPATGRIEGTPLDVQPRPQVWRITATNSGGKSSYYISLAVRSYLRDTDLEVSICMSTFVVNDAVITFRPRTEAHGTDFVGMYADHPQTLRLRVLDWRTTVIYQTSGAALGFVPRAAPVACGAVILDSWSPSPHGFPPPALCHWDGSPGKNAVIDVGFQGGATLEADQWYQLVVRMRVSEAMPAGTKILRLELICSEASSDESNAESEDFGAWTPTRSLPRWKRELSPKAPTPMATPLEDAPWTNGQAFYEPGFLNPLIGEAPSGLPFPFGFPAPGPTACVNSTSYCPTSPHYFENSPQDTAWYSDTGSELGVFPGFIVAAGDAQFRAAVLPTMNYNPFGHFDAVAMPRPAVPIGTPQQVYTPQQEFTVSLILAPDPTGAIALQRYISICPTSPLQTPLMSQGPTCEISDGPDFVACSCASTLPTDHPSGGARCDKVSLHITLDIDLRMEVTATLRIRSGATASFAGFWPVKWAGEVRSRIDGLYNFRLTANAALDIAPDGLVEHSTPAACAEVCLSHLVANASAAFPFACRSFWFNRAGADCYLSRYTASDPGVTLRKDWPGNPYDNYEYQLQVVFSVASASELFFTGIFVESALNSAGPYLEPPPPGGSLPFDVPHFVASYTDQRYLTVSVELVPAIPIHGRDAWRAWISFAPPPGFRPVALLAESGAVPTPQGLGYCAGTNYTCRWFLSYGQVLWTGAHYKFQMILHNPPVSFAKGQPWIIQAFTASVSINGTVKLALPFAMPHILPVEGWLGGCSAHFAAVQPLMASGRLSIATVPALDLYLVLTKAWESATMLQVVLPDAFPLPDECSAQPLTPWIDAGHLHCQRDVERGLVVRFMTPLRSNSSVGLRLSPLALPEDFDAVHAGFRVWPREQGTIQPMSLNIRLKVIAPGRRADEDGEACHPAVWECGLRPEAPADVQLRPSRHRFAFFEVLVGHTEPFRSTVTWALLQFAVNASLNFSGAADDTLIVTPPFGYSLLALTAASMEVLRRPPAAGQLNFVQVVPMSEAVNIDAPASVLKVTNLHGDFTATGAPLDGGAADVGNDGTGAGVAAGSRHFLNFTIVLPATGVEPSLLDPSRRESGVSACADAWGLALKSAGEHLVAGFAPATPLAYIAQFEVRCASRALNADNLLTFRFVTTSRALPALAPAGTELVVVLSLPAFFELSSPPAAAEFAAPFLFNKSTGRFFGASGPEKPIFPRLGCPALVVRARGRRMNAGVRSCAVHFNDGANTVDLAIVVDRLLAAADHEVLLRVRNPATAGAESVSTEFELSLFRTQPGLGLLNAPALPVGEGGPGAQLLRLQPALRSDSGGCGGPLLKLMPASVHRSSCLIDGRGTEVTFGFVAPRPLTAPVSVRLTAPAGVSFPWTCNFQATVKSIPADRLLDYIDETMISQCTVAPGGAAIDFFISQDLRALSVWTYFTVHAINPPASQAPIDGMQNGWSLVVDAFAAGAVAGADAVPGVPSPALKVFTDLELRELPFVYNDTCWAMAIQFRSSAPVPAGGYITLVAPEPFAFPAALCPGDAAGDAGTATGVGGVAAEESPGPGSPLFVPALPAQPIQPLREPPAVGESTAIDESPEVLLPPEPGFATCMVSDGGRRLVVAVARGQVAAGLRELRFVTVVGAEWLKALAAGAEDSALAPMVWSLESWLPAGTADVCTGGPSDCCPERRENFRIVVGITELELLDRGDLEAYPSGHWRGRQVVADAYGGWRYSDEPPA